MRRFIKDILVNYGLAQVLRDNQITIVEVIEVLEELGYINLEQYDDRHGDY